ncbi:MAG: extracellular solute-binding protein [Anaerolineales bacterium]
MMMRTIARLLVYAGLLFSAGCASLEPFLTSLTPAPAPTRQVTPAPTATATEPAPVESDAPVLRVWLPAQFSPAAENDAARLLKERLADFENQHPGLKIDVRVKTMEGENSLLNSLKLTSLAAPGALPDLIALSRSDLEAAALTGLLHPIDGLSTSLEDPNWYGYAQQLGRIQNTGYGLPFAGDALVLVYYPELGEIVTWKDVLASRGRLVFPASDPMGLVGLSLYASAGGELLDAQGQPTLDQDALTRVLSLVEQGSAKGVIPSSLANVSTEAQTLQIYRTGAANTNKGIIWSLDYQLPSDGTIVPLPGLDETSYSFSTGWVWALSGSNPEHQQLAVELAEHLTAEDFVGEWTRKVGYLPTRPSNVGEEERIITAILESAHPMPSEDVLKVLGPLMQEALTRVLNGEKPEDVAVSVVQKLK